MKSISTILGFPSDMLDSSKPFSGLPAAYPLDGPAVSLAGFQDPAKRSAGFLRTLAPREI
jgi:hypothetical protein